MSQLASPLTGDAMPGGGPLHWRTPSPKLWRARRLVLGAVAVPVIAAGGVLPAVAGSGTGGAVTAVVLAALAVAVFAVLRGRYRSWGYAEREDDLLVRRGLLLHRLSVVPYGRMQFIDVTAGPVDRAFGLATVQLHTAAATTDARIPGLPTAEAHRLRDALAALGESRAAGL